MADMRHVWSQIMPQLANAPVHLVETSPALRQRQKDRLAPANLFWHKNLDDLPATPVFGIANEFFDALPIDQAIWRDGQNGAAGSWRHRLVGLVDGRLGFVDGAPLSKAEIEIWYLASLPTPADGSIAECCAMADAYAAKLATHIASYGGACLIIDYGRDGPSGDSLQAVANHQPVDVFHQPGDADLSHWVDFSALRRAATNCGARLVGPVTQGDFLQAIGIAQRTEAVAKLADAETRRGLYAAVDRLVSSQQMGSAFKVAMMLPSGTGLPPGFAAVDDQGSTA
jgi:NADH dehydrogenase [ubiquinone] 1 alpha subcomplex assembly factor 7